MQRINQDIKTGQFHKLYLICGEERYLRNQYTAKLKKALIAEDDTMNLNQYHGKGVSLPQIIDLAETMPFFADRRVIIIEESGLFRQGGEALAEYLETPCETTFFIFNETELDKRSKLYKAVQKNGIIAEMTPPSPDNLLVWLGQLAKEAGLNITNQAANLLLAKTGTSNMENIRVEMEKAIGHALKKGVIEASDVEAVCVATISDNIFYMIDAIAEGSSKKAVELYYDMVALGEAPLKMIVLITRQFNILLQLKEQIGKGHAPQAAAQKLGLVGYRAKNAIHQASRFSYDSLKKALLLCAEADMDIKTGKKDASISLELLLLTLTSMR